MSDFVALQQQWTNWLRHPQTSPQPQVEQRRLTIYRELFFNNVCSFVQSAFPVLQQQLSTEVWQQLLDDFFANHRCQSPYFYDISYEFYQYLSTQTHLLADYPWLLELAHFEWAEIAADIAEGEWPDYQQGDLLTGVPVLNPFVWPLVYQWPVHKPEQLSQAEPSYLLLVRNQQHQVNCLAVNLMTFQLVVLLQQNPQFTGQRVIAQLAQQNNIQLSYLLMASSEVWSFLLSEDIILGTDPCVCFDC